MNPTKKIYRSAAGLDFGSGRTISGTAIVFGTWSVDLGGFRETILPGAVTEETLRSSDVLALMDHDPEYIMARSREGVGNLALTLTPESLRFSFEAPETAKGEELLQHVKRGEYDGCSFCFSIPEDGSGETWRYDDQNVLRREVGKIDRLYDVSVVYLPAYEATTVDARGAEIARLCSRWSAEEKEIKNILPYE